MGVMSHTRLVVESEAEDRPSERWRLDVSGVVQGVGFRPFVWQLAHRHGVAGFVRNTSAGVVVEIEGPARSVAAFRRAFPRGAPPLSVVTAVASSPLCPLGEVGFRIEASTCGPGGHQLVSPDVATCEDCVRELFDPADRRFGHPFINCTNCGPRYTIIEELPYDRTRTTMRNFAMCDSCRAEYEAPDDRRFHAQPIACGCCGPRLWLADRAGSALEGEAIGLAAARLGAGEIVAIKSLGGFQLACDATNPDAVERLRQRKRRPSKPFALMVRDLATASQLALVSAAEAAILAGRARPIVVLAAREEARTALAEAVAPRLGRLGIMLPYTPVHHLLLAAFDRPLVMTSGNLSEEPIAKDNAEALTRLAPLADVFLLHDRAICARYDDSVVQVVDGSPRMLRRARGYAPAPIAVHDIDSTAVALGAQLKNTFALAMPGYVLVGPHLGDLGEAMTLAHEQEALSTYRRLFRTEPTDAACDLHPDYASTRLAEEWTGRHGDERQPVRVQHHHAHIASVMAEQGLRGPLLGVAFDGSGFGTDGTAWGGEFLVCDELDFRRVAWLSPVSLPGGDLCAREGWRMAAAHLVAAGLPPVAPPGLLDGGETAEDEKRWRLVCRLAASAGVARTSSAGRLFDAVASLLGIRHHSSFEGEAAMRLESAAAGCRGVCGAPLRFDLIARDQGLVLDGASMVRRLVAGRDQGRSAADLAAGFHLGLAEAIVEVCERLRATHALDRVALSGGVFQNALLLTQTSVRLRERGFQVFANQRVPANDGGISLGQALVAASRARARGHRGGATTR